MAQKVGLLSRINCQPSISINKELVNNADKGISSSNFILDITITWTRKYQSEHGP